MSDSVGKPALLRWTAFRAGFAAGLGVLIVGIALVWLAYAALFPSAGYDVEVVSSGATLSKYGTHRLEVKAQDALIMRQTCNGACDDLEYRTKSAAEEMNYSVAVLDKAGVCISCNAGSYVDGVTGLVSLFSIRDDGGWLVDVDNYWPRDKPKR